MLQADGNLRKSELRGKYRHSVGEPGRTIEHEDGSETHLMPITYQSSILTLKRWERFEELTRGMGTHDFPALKGRWDLKGDSVILYRGDTREAYYVQASGNLLHSNGAYIYYRERE